MTTAPARTTPARPLTLLALCAALMLAVLVALPLPAKAHDTLISTDPADGSSVETSPEAIDFTFSADLLDVGSLVKVTLEDGTELPDIEPTVDGPVATAVLPEPLPKGTHTLAWRVVSSDGHPIEGAVTLTVENDPAAEEPAESAAAEPSDAGGAETQPEQTAPAQTAATEAPAAQSDDSSMTPLLIILGVAVIGAVVAALLIMRRRGDGA